MPTIVQDMEAVMPDPKKPKPDPKDPKAIPGLPGSDSDKKPARDTREDPAPNPPGGGVSKQ